MAEKTTTFQIPEELHKKLKEVAAREGTSMTEILVKQLEEYIKVHGNGNPVYKLDDWTTNPQFVAVPALLSQHDFKKKWLLSQTDPKLISEIKGNCQEWLHLIKEWEMDRLR